MRVDVSTGRPEDDEKIYKLLAEYSDALPYVEDWIEDPQSEALINVNLEELLQFLLVQLINTSFKGI